MDPTLELRKTRSLRLLLYVSIDYRMKQMSESNNLRRMSAVSSRVKLPRFGSAQLHLLMRSQ